jgi:hypothetical protein
MINAYKAHKILITFQCGTKNNKRNRGKVEILKSEINLNFYEIVFQQGKGNGGGGVPFLIQMKERMRDKLGMLPNTRLEAAHLANKCARTSALLETLLAFQL